MAGEDSRSVASPASPRRPVTRGSEVSVIEANQSDSPRAENETNGFEFVDWGPPPDLRKRELIFDAMSKIITTKPAADQQDRATGDNRGTHVFTWGAGYHGQLGLKFSRGMRKYSAIPRVIELNVVVRQIVCGALHTVVLTEAGTVYTWGDGRNAQLGHSSDTLTMQPSPVLVDSLGSAFVVQVACGRTHTLCLTDRGVMYSWGWNKYGQTGHGDRQVVKLPKAIDSSSTGKDVCFIDCGDKHSIAINKQGQAFSFGSNEHGQIGQGQAQDVLKPTRILESLENKFVKSSSSGTTHTAFLTADGEVYVCGFGEHLFPTESNRNVHSQFYTTPKHIPTPEPIKQVASGQGHILALSEQGNVFAWGNGEYGQLGHGARAHCNTPRLVLQGKDIHQVAAGRYHSTALTAFGAAYSWGCGENGQLGHDNDESVSIPRVINNIVGAVVGQVSCGEHHTAALTSAPWAKLSADMVDWLRRNQAEYDITQQFLKRVMRGLTNKDHARITAEVNKWQSEHDAKREEMAKEEADEIKRDYEAVQSRQALQSDVVLGMLARQSARMVTTDDIQSMLPGAGGPVERSISRRQSIDETTAEALAAFDTTEDEESKSGSTTALIPYPSTSKLQKKGKKNDTLAALLSPRAGDLDLGSTELVTSLSPALNGELTIQTARDAAGKEMGGRNKKGKGATVSLPDVFSPRDRKIDAGQSTALVPQPYVRSHFLKETAHAMKKMHKLVTEKGSSETQAELIRLQQLVIQLRKEYDSLHVCVGGMKKQFEALQREYEMLANGSGFQDRNAQKDIERLHELEMQLDSVNIKITETEENQKHYELNIWHLREEEREHVQQLEDIRRQCNDINLTFKRMSDLKQSAWEEKEKAEAELVEFKTEIVEYRRFIGNQLKSIQDVLDMSSRSAAEAAKEEHESARKEKSLALISAKLNSLSEEARQKEHQAKLLSEELLELDEKLKYHQGRFQQLANATGLTDPDAIVNKFFFKGEINQQLQTEIEEKQRLIEQLRGKQEDLREELNNSKTGFKDKRWRDVDTLQDQYRLAAARVQKTQTNVERSERKIVFVQEGLTNILRSLEKAQQLANDTASEHGSSPIATTIVEEADGEKHLYSTQSTEKSDALSHSGSEEALAACMSKPITVPGAYQGFSASLDSSQMWQDKECLEVFERLVSAMNWLSEMTAHPPTRQPKAVPSSPLAAAPSASPKNSPSQDSVMLASKPSTGALAPAKPGKRNARKTGVAAESVGSESLLKPVPPPRSNPASRNTARRRTNVAKP